MSRGGYTRDNGDPEKERPSLEGAAATWMTPNVPNGGRSDETLAKCADFRMRNAGQKTVPLYLEEVAVNWPTPAARDFKGANSAAHVETAPGAAHMDQLPNFVAHGFHPSPPDHPTPDGPPSSPERRSLNPLFVEWLMGWPTGLSGFARAETEFSRWLQQMRAISGRSARRKRRRKVRCCDGGGCMNAYADFLARKAIVDVPTGIVDPGVLPEMMFGFQADIARWALRRGRAAMFAGTGLGKSLMELAWGGAVARETRRPILHLAPLAVSAQMVREAQKFGVAARLVSRASEVEPGAICITNYQKLGGFDIGDFGGVALDESSILKNVDGHYRAALISACSSIPFRLAATATPAPNDFMELGNHAEFLGVMSYTDMLATFFTHDGGDTAKWRLKGHAENEFWKWMASWAVMLRRPSDLGYSDDGYDLPPLNYQQHIVRAASGPDLDAGTLFPFQARTLGERITARRESATDRCRLAASITPGDRPFVWWCNLNAESEMLTKMIPGAVETRGSDADDVKERKLVDFSEGRIRVLVTKPGVAGFGMNWQHCRDTGFVGLSDSWEQFYQAVRRFWRFGQTGAVTAHVIAGEMEGATLANIRRKDADAERMAAAMVRHMADLSSAAVRGMVRDTPGYAPTQPVRLPDFIREAA